MWQKEAQHPPWNLSVAKFRNRVRVEVDRLYLKKSESSFLVLIAYRASEAMFKATNGKQLKSFNEEEDKMASLGMLVTF